MWFDAPAKDAYQYTHADLNQLLFPYPARMDIVKVQKAYPWAAHIRAWDYLIIDTSIYPKKHDYILMKQDGIVSLYQFIKKSMLGVLVVCCKNQERILCADDLLFVWVITSSFSRYMH